MKKRLLALLSATVIAGVFVGCGSGSNNVNQQDTSENAKVMVEAATKSSQLLEENMAVIASIRNDADSITETNGNKYCTAVY